MSAVDIAGKTAEESFYRLLEQYREDAACFVPDNARKVIGKYGKETKYVVLGTKDFGAQFIAALGEKGRALHVVDDFKCHRGEQFWGVDIISTDVFLDLVKKDPAIVAINSCRYDHSKRFFDDLCRRHEIPCLNFEQAVRVLDLNSSLDYRVADWAQVIADRADGFVALSKRLADSYSQETLWRVLSFHLTCDPEWYLNVARPYCTLYFRSGLLSFTDHEKFVDCGASIAESTTGLIGTTQGKFDRAWMIEPDNLNIKTLKQFLRRFEGTDVERKVSLHPYAVGESRAMVPFNHVGGHGGSILPGGDEKPSGMVELRPVDEIIDDAPTFIKMDIEGFELPALKGSVKSIQAGHPKMAISAYHRATDLLDLPAFVDSIEPGYRIGLRHHTEDRWDTCLYFY
ncbi:FkbM family methyltransferase [Paraburkholderia unamae]|uniref:FkbM family methyltransferase n=1 Tax=Paraburkholderia unamae TaxID=219649 RepID=A0ABX5KZ51_9BURK|nr:FkbM family methyltransferase [Paraburkholderia unamae]PVX97428.1 FkbM family methyltransferase [Paraburkholderia unamae]CAG9274084.1 Methyltransferase FkbM [Paraburkholderia unamae]